MSRIYTKSLIASDGAVSPELFNQENNQIANTFNGNLDCHQIPADSIDWTKLAPRTTSTSGVFDISRGPIHVTYSGWSYSEEDLWTPQLTVSLAANNRQGGWYRLADDISTASVTMTSLNPGVITGVCVVDWEKRRGHTTVTSAGARENDISWPIEFMVFYDGAPEFPTGPLYPRRHTSEIQIMMPTSGGTHTFDVRWRAKAGTLTEATATTALQNVSFNFVGFSLTLTQA